MSARGERDDGPGGTRYAKVEVIKSGGSKGAQVMTEDEMQFARKLRLLKLKGGKEPGDWDAAQKCRMWKRYESTSRVHCLGLERKMGGGMSR